jgi:hypothetical protein
MQIDVIFIFIVQGGRQKATRGRQRGAARGPQSQRPEARGPQKEAEVCRRRAARPDVSRGRAARGPQREGSQRSAEGGQPEAFGSEELAECSRKRNTSVFLWSGYDPKTTNALKNLSGKAPEI